VVSRHVSLLGGRSVGVALKRDQRMLPKCRKGDKLIVFVATHWKIRTKVAHLIPLLHLGKGKRSLNVSLGVDVLPSSLRGCSLRPVVDTTLLLLLLGLLLLLLLLPHLVGLKLTHLPLLDHRLHPLLVLLLLLLLLLLLT